MTIPAARVPITRFQVRIDETRVRATPARGLDGAPFAGPPVDLDPAAALDIVRLTTKIAAWFDEREPGITLRSIAIHLPTGRVIATLTGAPHPRVLRIEPNDAEDLVARAAPLIARLEELTATALAAR